MMEIWKDIPTAPGYQASSYGRVRSVGRLVRAGEQVRQYRGKILAPTSNQYGHLKVSVSTEGGPRKLRYVHAIVGETFIGPRPEGAIVCHSDGDPSNNAPENLRYGTAAENSADMVIHGSRAKGSAHHQTRLSDEDVAAVRAALSQGQTQAAIAATYGVARSTISAIATGRSRKFDAHSDSPAHFVGRLAA